jgi:hypothetical protein
MCSGRVERSLELSRSPSQLYRDVSSNKCDIPQHNEVLSESTDTDKAETSKPKKEVEQR